MNSRNPIARVTSKMRTRVKPDKKRDNKTEEWPDWIKYLMKVDEDENKLG